MGLTTSPTLMSLGLMGRLFRVSLRYWIPRSPSERYRLGQLYLSGGTPSGRRSRMTPAMEVSPAMVEAALGCTAARRSGCRSVRPALVAVEGAQDPGSSRFPAPRSKAACVPSSSSSTMNSGSPSKRTSTTVPSVSPSFAVAASCSRMWDGRPVSRISSTRWVRRESGLGS